MTPSQRKQFVQSKNLCFKCLRPGHAIANCPSKFSCRHCSKKHHSLLHFDVAIQPKRFEKANVSTTDNPEIQKTLTSFSDKAVSKSDQGRTVALLGTCRLAVEDKNGRNGQKLGPSSP